jgi:hypothetical protein
MIVLENIAVLTPLYSIRRLGHLCYLTLQINNTDLTHFFS